MANFTDDLFDVFDETDDILEIIPNPVKPKDVNTTADEK